MYILSSHFHITLNIPIINQYVHLQRMLSQFIFRYFCCLLT